MFVRRFDELDAREITELPPATRQLVWSPDGLAIGFAAEGAVQSIPADGGQRFVISKIPASGRLTGLCRTLIYLHDDRGRGLLRIAAIVGDGTTEGKPSFQVDQQTNVRDFDVSSDGRLLASVLVQPDGRGDIYLVDLRDLTAQRLVHEGGMRPRFSGDGRELFFTAGARDEQGQREGRLMRVAVTSASTVTVGLANQVLRDVPNGFLLSTCDVAPEGDRFLMWKPVPPAPGERQRLVFVQNALSAVRPLR